MCFANNISKRSCDQKLQVGAVVVTDDNTRVLALGYNGDEKGGPNVRDSMKSGESGFIHAEINAITKLDYSNKEKKTMYVTHSPCSVCAKVIINAGIDQVVYEHVFKGDPRGLDILSRSSVIVRRI